MNQQVYKHTAEKLLPARSAGQMFIRDFRPDWRPPQYVVTHVYSLFDCRYQNVPWGADGPKHPIIVLNVTDDKVMEINLS